VLLLGGCASLPSSLSPRSPAAAQIATLWWIMFWLGTIIWVGVTILLLVGLFRHPRTPGMYAPLPEENHARTVNLWVVGGGIVFPILVLISLIALTVGALRVIPTVAPSNALVIEVTGHQWWWEVHYLEEKITLQDEIRIPAGQPVQVRLSSADVIHSFWAPELHGKFDLIPGRTQAFVLQADQPGEYRGQCAEFCGRRHARMTFVVVAMLPEEFTTWLNSQTQAAVGSQP
jgi:cytochrome c oxidase subunit 2